LFLHTKLSGNPKLDKAGTINRDPYTMFRDYTESGPALMTGDDGKIIGRFILENTSTTIANTIRRLVLTETRSAGFRADLTNSADPGVTIRKNTSAIFNEMLAHRMTLVPLGVRNLDSFDPKRYECVLHIKNEVRGPITPDTLRHVSASDFIVRERQEDGSFADLGTAGAAALFPVDPITKQSALIITLRPQWNPEQPAEEVDLTAYPVIGRGREYMGFCPVSQCSFENTRDEDPVRQERFFTEWLAAFKKVADPSALTAEQAATHRQEWMTLGVQRCFQVDDRGEPNSFSFTVESVGVRPVPDIVAEGIRAAIDLVAPYADSEKTIEELGLTIQPIDSRMNGVDVLFEDQEHTLGNLLQTLITEEYLEREAADSPITFAGYKVRHPLHRAMTLRIGIREGAAAGGNNTAIARQVISVAAAKAKTIFEDLGRAWAAVAGSSTTATGPELEG
jgi:DNA-directed RNA polymerase subunit L